MLLNVLCLSLRKFIKMIVCSLFWVQIDLKIVMAPLSGWLLLPI